MESEIRKIYIFFGNSNINMLPGDLKRSPDESFFFVLPKRSLYV